MTKKTSSETVESNGELTIYIPIGDWDDEWQASPIKPETTEDIIATMQETRMTPTQMARLAIVGRERKYAAEDIVQPNILSLMFGTARFITNTIVRREVDVEINGKNFKAREYVATVTRGEGEEVGEDEGETLVGLRDPIAVDRATRYLFNVITGFIKKRLIILAANDEDIHAIAERLKTEIDNIVAELS